MRGLYDFRRRSLRAPVRTRTTTAPPRNARIAYQRLRRELLDAERQAIVELRGSGYINDEVMYRVQRDIDLEVARLDAER